MSRKDKWDEYYDLCYDVWRSGGDMDGVDRDTFEGYDSWHDEHILQAELRRQRPPEPQMSEEEYYQQFEEDQEEPDGEDTPTETTP